MLPDQDILMAQDRIYQIREFFLNLLKELSLKKKFICLIKEKQLELGLIYRMLL